METITMRPIAHVRPQCADAEVSRRRRDIVSEVIVLPEFSEALTGIEQYSHLFILFHMHRLAVEPTELRIHPRGDPTLPLTGILASRGRNHPNGIGLAVVELLARDANVLQIRRLDAFDGTPVIDIKPYDHYDVFAAPRMPAWLAARPGNT